MYLRETHHKRAEGSVVTQLQRAERVWTPHKKRSEVRIVAKCGRAEAPQTAERLRQLARSLLKKCAPPESVAQAPQWRVLDPWPFGALDVREAMGKRLGLPDVLSAHLASRHVDFAVERALCAMGAHRACAPSSNLSCAEQWVRGDVRLDGPDALVLPPRSRAMDGLEAHKAAMEHAVSVRRADFRNLDGELLFYETTSVPGDSDDMDQGDGEDELVAGRLAAGANTDQAPRPRGLSNNGRSDAPQVVIGLAVTREGVPGRHWVLPGKTVDVTTGAHGKADLRGWHLSRCGWVGDAGRVSQDHLHKLSARGGQYRRCRPMRRGDEGTTEVLQRPGRSQPVSDHLRVKAVVVGEGERRRRDVVWHHPDEETRQRAHRHQVLRALEAELAALPEVQGASHRKRVCQLRASRRSGRDVRLTQGGRLRMDAANRRAEAQLDGKCVVDSHDDRLTPAELAVGDTQRPRLLDAWRPLTSGRRLRPVDHGAVHRMQAHVALSGLAL